MPVRLGQQVQALPRGDRLSAEHINPLAGGRGPALRLLVGIEGAGIMADDTPERERLIHELRNVQAEKQALKHLLGKAVDQIEELVANDCEDAAKQAAAAQAERLRRVAD